MITIFFAKTCDYSRVCRVGMRGFEQAANGGLKALEPLLN
jgi:hypothetical protein